MTLKEYLLCKRKIPYSKKRQALNVLKKMKKNGKGISLNIYRCDVCNMFHVGNRNYQKKNESIQTQF